MQQPLTMSEWALVGVLLYNEGMTLSFDQLVQLSGMSHNTVRAARRKLVESGVISFVVCKEGATYRVHYHKQPPTQSNAEQSVLPRQQSPRTTAAEQGVSAKRAPVAATLLQSPQSSSDSRAIIAEFSRRFGASGKIGQRQAGQLLEVAGGSRELVLEAIEKAVDKQPEKPFGYVRAIIQRMVEEGKAVQVESSDINTDHAMQLTKKIQHLLKERGYE